MCFVLPIREQLCDPLMVFNLEYWFPIISLFSPGVTPKLQVNLEFLLHIHWSSRSQWPRGLRRRSAATSLLRSWVRIPPGAWMFVCSECCVLSGRGLCDELITRPEEPYRLWFVVVYDVGTSLMRRSWPNGRCRAKNKQYSKVRGNQWCSRFILRILPVFFLRPVGHYIHIDHEIFDRFPTYLQPDWYSMINVEKSINAMWRNYHRRFIGKRLLTKLLGFP